MVFCFIRFSNIYLCLHILCILCFYLQQEKNQNNKYIIHVTSDYISVVDGEVDEELNGDQSHMGVGAASVEVALDMAHRSC
jgi:hypothetical protein